MPARQPPVDTLSLIQKKKSRRNKQKTSTKSKIIKKRKTNLCMPLTHTKKSWEESGITISQKAAKLYRAIIHRECIKIVKIGFKNRRKYNDSLRGESVEGAVNELHKI